jgi:hypothetical protein
MLYFLIIEIIKTFNKQGYKTLKRGNKEQNGKYIKDVVTPKYDIFVGVC